ncbi:MAG: hypothetical protein HC825_02325 [Oscillatoriales cyanobacterium RM1_1_9]|nr:hypothetical protein [Oscillatoriales cyanobacterium SM2_3_0]NJO46243.1 hypothetical protein [Oscillatoriales cyanobacterium RM2_1_1]NJO70841.1 hypothetical protein [Oscillatoriales cyanobacterium RM1_1_9]
MNTRVVIFSGLVMAGLGSVFGLAVSELQRDQYQCCGDITRKVDLGYSQSKTPERYILAGAVMGFGVGSILESIRQASPNEAEE